MHTQCLATTADGIMSDWAQVDIAYQAEAAEEELITVAADVCSILQLTVFGSEEVKTVQELADLTYDQFAMYYAVRACPQSQTGREDLTTRFSAFAYLQLECSTAQRCCHPKLWMIAHLWD